MVDNNLFPHLLYRYIDNFSVFVLRSMRSHTRNSYIGLRRKSLFRFFEQTNYSLTEKEQQTKRKRNNEWSN